MNNTENVIIDKLKLLIEQNLDSYTLSLETICKHLGISRSQLHRVVTEQTHLSTTIFIRKIRLQKAKELLENTSLRISEIAYAIGIDSPQNFSQYFAESFNVSPTSYRKQLNKITQQTTDVSVAVLPFVNISNDPEQEYLSDGITEELINMLAQVPHLKVVGRTSVFTFKGKNQDLRQIGQQLNVSHIIEGSVRKSANKLRISVQLIKVEDGYHVWSEKFDKEITDIFDIQDEISLAILDEIKIKLFGTEKNAVLKKHTYNHKAHQLYLHGRYFFNKFSSADNFIKAIAYYDEAIEIEPNYALAYSGIASCYLYLWFYRHLEAEVCMPKMKLAAEKAIELDDEIAESHLAIGRMKLYYEWDFKAAEKSFQKAISLGPNMAEAYQQNALWLGISGNIVKAEQHAIKALELDPFSLINNYYTAYIFWLVGDFVKALAQGRKLVELEPNFWGGHSIIGFNLIELKKFQEALPELELAISQNNNSLILGGYGVLFGLMDNKNKALDVLAEMEKIEKKQPIAHYDRGIVYACIGDFETANSYFEKAIQHHEPPMLFFKYIVRDWLINFKNDVRCKSLIQKIGLPNTK